MYDEQQICPYTGLRSFTEEESLYFKGREEDIDQATLQLQRNKFLMLTGASGDGKSSLVYAGIIPNARAGFLKAKYTNWRVADFRPERDPFGNLCRAVTRELGVANLSTVESELGHGFSALVDLYRNSPLFLDQESGEWQRADDRRKAAMKREAANLIILVDQFEEFFTNPENYRQGAPSKESNMVLNILLETARISLEEDLPIYVVFTMRSDYIGQCAAFRGLPENIGFSQFFVPRLNRSQLQQVIEEPATLSGNRITRRLTERLIHDITEGVDQLPILQHALNQIWVAADSGKEEMDLIHYAMVGGMPVGELPDEQVPRFKEWFAGLPPYIQACYHKPGLHNVLDTHTNKLYEQAGSYYREHTGKTLSDADAKRIIRSAFTCLTKIDQGRAVRNRMTLEEITHIIGDPVFDVRMVGEVLNIFREPGNTFIHPFILHEEEDSRQLPAGQVLDITHESLIRNWQYLGQWAKEEYDSRSVSLDLDVQLDRWVSNGKSKDYLMSIGQLTYFETWFNKTRPNAWWMARYLPGDAGAEAKLGKAKVLLDDTKEFLAKSASKHAITRAFMKYGTRRIAAVLGAILFLGLMSFVVNDYMNKQNSAILKKLQSQSVVILNNDQVNLLAKAWYVTEAAKLGQRTVGDALRLISDTIERINVANGVAEQFFIQGHGVPVEETDTSVTIAEQLLRSIQVPVTDPKRLELALRQLNNVSSSLELGCFFSPSTSMKKHREVIAGLSAQWAMTIAERQPAGVKNMQEFGMAIENGLNNRTFKKEEIRKLLTILSPFENQQRSEWLLSNFQSDKLMDRGEEGYGFLFNGLYQELAYLYASEGDADHTLQCIDTLLLYGQRNFQGDYANGADNASNIAVMFYRSGHGDGLDAFVKGYCERKKTTEIDFYRRLLARSFHERATQSGMNLYWWQGYRLNFNTRFSPRDQVIYFSNKYRDRLSIVSNDPNEKLYLAALSFKDEGILKSLNHEQPLPGERTVTADFDTAVSLFRRVDPAYTRQSLKLPLSNSDEMIISRRAFFVHPDAKMDFNPFEPRAFFYFHFGDAFLQYILDKKLMTEFYQDKEDWDEISSWFTSVKATGFVPTSFMAESPSYAVLRKLDSAIGDGRRTGTDLNMLYLLLGREAQKAGDTSVMLASYRKLQTENLFNLLHTTQYGGNPNNFAFRNIAYAVKGYFQTGHDADAVALVRRFKLPANRSSIYAFIAGELYEERADVKLAARLTDSARKELSRTEQGSADQPNRQFLAYTLALQDSEKNAGEINRLIRNLPGKSQALAAFSRADAFNGSLFKAMDKIPDLVSDEARLNHYWFILYGYGHSGQTPPTPASWGRYDDHYVPINIHLIEYVNEDN